MHAYNSVMRTTVEIPDDLRLRLIEESARTGDRGYSGIVSRALREYFQRQGDPGRIRDQVAALYGSQRETGDEVEIAPTRESWRIGRTIDVDEHL